MKMKWSALMTEMVTKMMRTIFLRLLQNPMQKKGWGANQGGRGASTSHEVGVEVLVFLMVSLILEI